MRHQRKSADDGLDGNIVDPFLKQRNVDSICLQLLEDAGNGPLVADAHVLAAVIEHKLRVMLVDRVIGQVNVLLF